MNLKKNITLIVAISIPILMIVLVAAVIYLPRFFYHPGYNFLYVTSGDYYALQQYDVRDERLVVDESNKPDNYKPSKELKLYVYDVETGTSSEVAYEDARELSLDSSRMSPDGFEIVSGGHGGGFFPFSFSSDGDYCTRYISGHNTSRKLELKLTGDSYCGGFQFIGWIQQDA